jgi:molybdate transport system substrate-binding protein
MFSSSTGFVSKLVCVYLSCSLTFAAEIQVAAAADLEYAFRDVAQAFERQTGATVRLSFGSSGNLVSQLENGAPFDLFFSADSEYPKKLESDGLVETGTLYPYATGKLVLWVRNDSRLDLSRGLAVLLQHDIKTIAIADPAHAPYGRIATAALKSQKLYDRIQSKLVFGENIAQTAQFVQSGNADVGMLALSLALSPVSKGQGRYYVIPASAYPALIQTACILRSSQNKDVAEQFMDFLKSQPAVETMQRYGFEVAATKP